MKNKRVRIVIGLLSIVVVVWIIKGTFFQPSANGLKAGIRDVAKYRNENNTGPVQYVFIAMVKDSLWKDLETYGNYKPHHKGGNTRVYYFMEGSAVPANLSPGKVNFDPSFNSACIALYEKSAMGNTSLIRHPF
ncbi:MAG TPA: hypothetical protein VKB19_06590 [Pedobacter sp.]|nr:hypothetical protein [Pedobacter sp.]